MSEQLAAEQEKVKALEEEIKNLQPYKDAYDGGEEWFAPTCEDTGRIVANGWSAICNTHGRVPVRVCKVIKLVEED